MLMVPVNARHGLVHVKHRSRGRQPQRCRIASVQEPHTVAVEDNVKTVFVAETLLPTRAGLFRLRGYRHSIDGGASFTEPTAMVCGDVNGKEGVPVRVHDACFTSEVLGSLKCDCAEQLQLALRMIQDNPPGLVIYLQQEGRGIGLANKIAAYAMQERGLDTVDANRALGLPDDCREYTSVRHILSDLNVKSVKLMTNNPRKINVLTDLGVEVVGRIPCIVKPGEFNQGYLMAKETRMEHLLDGSWCYFSHDGEPVEPSVGPLHGPDSHGSGPFHYNNGSISKNNGTGSNNDGPIGFNTASVTSNSTIMNNSSRSNDNGNGTSSSADISVSDYTSSSSNGNGNGNIKSASISMIQYGSNNSNGSVSTRTTSKAVSQYPEVVTRKHGSSSSSSKTISSCYSSSVSNASNIVANAIVGSTSIGKDGNTDKQGRYSNIGSQAANSTGTGTGSATSPLVL